MQHEIVKKSSTARAVMENVFAIRDWRFLVASFLTISHFSNFKDLLLGLTGRGRGLIDLYSVFLKILLEYNNIIFKRGGYSEIKSITPELLHTLIHDYDKLGSSSVEWIFGMKFWGLLYQICQIMKPEVIVETGVCWGFSTACILQSLKNNKKGSLYSIDIPPPYFNALNATSGCLIPTELKEGWKLFEGTSSELLPPLLDKLGCIDLFIHDSLHTYDNMMFEYEAAWNHIRHGGLLMSHDTGIHSFPFRDFAERKGLNYINRNQIGIIIK
jgi:predicted O-methyltransferase YrrM